LQHAVQQPRATDGANEAAKIATEWQPSRKDVAWVMSITEDCTGTSAMWWPPAISGIRVQVRHQLKMWPAVGVVSCTPCPNPLRHIRLDPGEMPERGVFLSVCLNAGFVAAGEIAMPHNSMLKVPSRCAAEATLRLPVTGPTGRMYDLYVRVADAVDAPPPQHAHGWVLGGLEELIGELRCGHGDELSIEG
jgi:hypothetical protein